MSAALDPGAARSPTREDHVHRASRADGALAFALTTPHFAAVHGSRKLGLRRAIEKRQLHFDRR
jgi:hypothetical protein